MLTNFHGDEAKKIQNGRLKKRSFSISANSQYFFSKFSWMGPWVSRIDWCKGNWCDSTYKAVRLSNISSNRLKIHFLVIFLASDNCLTTTWQLLDDCPTTVWQLPDDCLTKAKWLQNDCQTTAWQFPQQILYENWNRNSTRQALLLIPTRGTVCGVSFDWFLSCLEWIIYLEFFLLKRLLFYKQML